MTGQLRVGTSGYAYGEWKGGFYPTDAAPADFLSVYSNRLDTVEINNTFYRFPKTHVLESWRDQVPDTFRFAVKANRRITHVSKLDAEEPTLADFLDRIGALGDRLGPVLFQIPPYLRADGDRLRRFVDALPPDGQYVLEVRHRSWFESEHLDRLRSRDVVLCWSDDEKLTSPPEETGPFIYARLRRNEYAEGALEDWGARIRERVQSGLDAYVFFKHDEEADTPMPPMDRFLRGAGTTS